MLHHVPPSFSNRNKEEADQIEEDEDLDESLPDQDESSDPSPSEAGEDQRSDPSPSHPPPPIAPQPPVITKPPVTPVIDLESDLPDTAALWSSQRRLLERRNFLKRMLMEANIHKRAREMANSGVNAD